MGVVLVAGLLFTGVWWIAQWRGARWAHRLWCVAQGHAWATFDTFPLSDAWLPVHDWQEPERLQGYVVRRCEWCGEVDVEPYEFLVEWK